MSRILLIEDDRRTAVLVQEALRQENHVVDVAFDGKDGLDLLLRYAYDLAVIDWSLPQLTGPEVCTEYRQRGGNASILFLTGRTAITNRVEALEGGADDYLCKPFDHRELMARVKALLRRTYIELIASLIIVKHVELDRSLRRVRVKGKDVQLAPNELQLLELFMRNPRKVFTYDELIERVYKAEFEATDDAVRQRIVRVRKKIDVEGEESLIKTVKGLGYSFDPGEE